MLGPQINFRRLHDFIEYGYLSYPHWPIGQRDSLMWRHLPFRNTCYSSLLEAADDSIKSRVQNLSHVGVMFSGGVDSSTLAMIASRHTRVTLYMMDFGMCPEENAIADECAKHLGLRLIRERHSLRDHYAMLHDAVRNLQAPGDIDTQVLHTYRLARANGDDTLLSGLGMDEVQAGYPELVKAPPSLYHEFEETSLETCHCGYAWRNHAQRETSQIMFPFLDAAFVGYAVNLPLDDKRRGLETKVRLREEVKSRLPRSVVEAGRVAGTKRGYTPLLETWWADGLGAWCVDEVKKLSSEFSEPHRPRRLRGFLMRRLNRPSWRMLRLANTATFLDIFGGEKS